VELKQQTLALKLADVVFAIKECQDTLSLHPGPAGPGYVSAFPETLLDRFEAAEPVWAPLYILHKLLQGLLDVSEFFPDSSSKQKPSPNNPIPTPTPISTSNSISTAGDTDADGEYTAEDAHDSAVLSSDPDDLADTKARARGASSILRLGAATGAAAAGASAAAARRGRHLRRRRGIGLRQ